MQFPGPALSVSIVGSTLLSNRSEVTFDSDLTQEPFLLGHPGARFPQPSQVPSLLFGHLNSG